MIRFTFDILNSMNLLLVAGLLQVGPKPVATGGHGADERVGGLILLLQGGGDLGVMLLDVRLKEFWVMKGPGHSLLPAGIAVVILLVVRGLLDTLVDGPLVPPEIPDQGEADGTQLALVWLLLEMDRDLVSGQMWSLAEAQATGGTLNNISITNVFTLN